MVTQPKSIATVVVVLALPSPGSSTPMPALVISASVVSGAISEIAPTVVVLPTPKPPAMRSLTGMGGAAVAPVRVVGTGAVVAGTAGGRYGGGGGGC